MCFPLIGHNNINEYFEFVEKCFNKLLTFSKSVIWATKTKINLYRLYMKSKVGAGPIQAITLAAPLYL